MSEKVLDKKPIKMALKCTQLHCKIWREVQRSKQTRTGCCA